MIKEGVCLYADSDFSGWKRNTYFRRNKINTKALVRIGNKPIIEHIMECYEKQGFNEFLILTGYKEKKYLIILNRKQI